MSDAEKQPFTNHLGELRKRLIYSFIAIAIGFAVSFAFKIELFEILVAPLKKAMAVEKPLIYVHLPEAFITYLKTALIFGILLAAPVLIYQFWIFVAPGLYDKEKKLLIPILFLSVFFFAAGVLFAYFIVFPWGFKFFLSFESDTAQSMQSMKYYLSFSAKMLLAFGVVFEMPLVITFLARLGIVSVEFLKKYRKYSILIFFVGAAMLTPPDVVTQIIMAFPLMLLYEISILGARIFGQKDIESEEDDQAADTS